MELPDRSQARSWEGKDVVDRDGERIGRCVGVFADTATGVPEWLHVDVTGHARSFVPAVQAEETDGTVRVRFAREAVLRAPVVGDDEQLSKAEELELYRHYGIPVEGGDGSVLPAADAAAGEGTPAAAAGTAPVVGTSERTSTAAAASSGADTSVAETDAEADAGTADTPALVPPEPASAGSGTADGTSALSASDAVSGAVVTPETGEQLPVLDPSAASTPVPEDQVTYVDEPEPPSDRDTGDSAPEAPPAPAPEARPAPTPPVVEQPRPTLHRVPPASPPPAPAPATSGSDLSALTPLGAVAGVAAAVALVLRARERRQRRRRSAAARAGRLGDTLRASAGSTLAGVSEAAELTRRSARTATGKAAGAAARQQERAAAAGRRQRAQTASALSAASKTAAQQKKAAARRAAQQRKAAAASLAGASSRGSSAADSVGAVPRKVAKRGRKARRSLGRTLWDTVVLGTAGGGYVLGAKAGRQRYDELAQVAAAVAASPKVQAATEAVTEAVTDPERRTDLLVEVQQQARSLVGRRGKPRS